MRSAFLLLLLVALPAAVHAQQHRELNVNATATGVQSLRPDDRVFRLGIGIELEQHRGNAIRRYGIGYTPASDHTPGLLHARAGFGAYRTISRVTAGVHLDAGVLRTSADAMADTWAACTQTPCMLQEPEYETGWAVQLGSGIELRVALAQRLTLIGTFAMQSLVIGENEGESFWVFAGGVAYRF